MEHTALLIAASLIFSQVNEHTIHTSSVAKPSTPVDVLVDSVSGVVVTPNGLDTTHDFKKISECWVLFSSGKNDPKVRRKHDWTVSGDGMIFTDGNPYDTRCAARFTSAGIYTVSVSIKDANTNKEIITDSTTVTIRQK